MRNPKEIEVKLVQLAPSYTRRMQFADDATKPIMCMVWDLAGLRDIQEMGIAVAGDEERLRRKPFLIRYALAIAPLVHPKEFTEKVLF